MKQYEIRNVALRTHVGTVCDGCGEPGETADGGDLHEVVISVDEGADDGQLDVYDYCDPCLRAWKPLLKAAGSTAPIIIGVLAPDGDDD